VLDNFYPLLYNYIMGKMASLHAEGLTDEDLETAEIVEILESLTVG